MKRSASSDCVIVWPMSWREVATDWISDWLRRHPRDDILIFMSAPRNGPINGPGRGKDKDFFRAAIGPQTRHLLDKIVSLA